MTLSPRCTIVCIGFFLFNKQSVCKNVFQNETDSPTTATVELSLIANDDTRTVGPSDPDQITNVTRDCVFESSDHKNNIITLWCNGDATAAVNDAVTTRSPAIFSRNTRTASLQVTQKPATKKSAIVTKPPRRQNVTAKSVAKNNPKARTTTTAWPKPDKRLGGGGGGGGSGGGSAGNVLGVVKTAPNGTADDGSVETDFKTKYPVGLWKEHGFYTDEYLELINSHWFTFTPPNPTSHYLFAVLYTVIMVCGCFGNSLVIFMYIKSVPPRATIV